MYTGIHDTSTIPLNDQFEVTYDEEDDEFPPIERSRPVLKKKTRQVVQYENFEESGVSTDNFLKIDRLLLYWSQVGLSDLIWA